VLTNVCAALLLSDARASDAVQGQSLLKVVAPVIPAGAMDFQEGAWAEHHYQPSFFDPANPTESTPADAGPHPTQTRLAVSPPYAVEVYAFSNASNEDYVVEIREDKKRHMLLTHVDRHIPVSPSRRHMLVSNNLRTSDGRWQHLLRIIDIPTKTKTRLPHMSCTEKGWRWDGDRVITWGLTKDARGWAPAPGLNTPVCFWNVEGQLLHRVQARACWHAASDDYMDSALGLLPADEDVLWLYNGDCQSMADAEASCRVHLFELTGPQRHRAITLEEATTRYGCPTKDQITFDMQSATFDQPVFRYRVDPNKKGNAVWKSAGTP